MSNIEKLKREGLAARVTWDFGADTLPIDDRPRLNVEAHTVRCRVCGKLCARPHSGPRSRRRTSQCPPSST